ILRKNFQWLILLLTVSLLTAFLYLRYTHPVYQANSTLKIGMVNTANAVLNQPGSQMYELINGSNNAFAGDVELMRSREMVKRIIEKLPLEVTYYLRGAILDNELYEQCPFSIEYELLDSSIYGVLINVDFLPTGEYRFEYEHLGKTVSSTGRPGEWKSTPEFKMRLQIVDSLSIQKHNKRIKDYPYYFCFNTTADLTEEYYENYSVTIVNPSAQTVRVTFKDQNDRKAADFVNMAISEFNASEQERKSEGSIRSLAFIDETIASIDSELKISEVSLELFKTRNKIINPNENAHDALEHINQMVNDRVKYQLGLAVMMRLEKNLNTLEDIENLVPLMAGDYEDDVIKKLLDRVQELQDKKASLRFMATD
ncbi:MAG TPA: hypothetical protein P5292_14130, partial [Bacteroidia bacterium]|nr:hypothetical protein [Bacteroidia bacterium]